MRWLKIVALLLFTLAVMRASSWALDWVLARVFGANARLAAIASNAAACAAFILLLYLNRLPGEPMDFAAAVFGIAVFGLYTVWDLFRSPWKRKT